MRHKFADVVTGVAAAVVVFAAVPAVLIALVGVPLPDHWDRSAVISSRGLFDLLAVMAWVAWVACCWPLLCAVAARVRRRDATAPPDARLPEWLATRIAAAVLTVAPVGLTLGAVAGASGHRHPPVVQALAPAPAAVPAPVAGPAIADEAAPASASGSSASGASASDDAVPAEYTVVAGDTLWSIAERLYGDGAAWSAIAQANLGHVMGDGQRFVDPSLILPGWVLSIPPAAEPASTDSPGPGPTAVATATATATATTMSPVPPAAAVRAQPTASQAPTDPAVGMPAPTPTDAAGGAHHHRRSSRHRDRTAGPAGPVGGGAPGPVPLPELAALGVGVVLAAAFARRVRRARSLGALGRPEGIVPEPVAEPLADTAALVAPFIGAPALDWLETANRHLAGALVNGGPADGSPDVQLVRVGPDGVELVLAAPLPWVPERWTAWGERSWHLSSALDPGPLAAEARAHGPWLPVLLPVGENQAGCWLVPVQPGHCLSVLGAEAGAQVAAMQAAAGSWSWSEAVVATADPATARREASMADTTPAGPGTVAVVFFGDPRRLDPATRARCAAVTTLPLAGTDLTVVADATAVSVHPLGLTLRPGLLAPARAAALDELFALGETSGPDRTEATHVGAPAHRDPDDPFRQGAGDTAGGSLAPGPVEVRLLTPIPRIDGLTDELPPKRARRAVELVAYLSLHHPEPVTGDRLRTRVLGSADADAAAKTLFNTAGAGRRALGRDPDGEPYLPPATKSGHYRVSARVTVDAARAVALTAAAELADDRAESMALQREALGLVEGEPLSGILTGYNWWGAEGHEQQVAAALVDAACQLARRATETGHLELARWALGRARMVDPYSETLSRAAMEVAAEAGDIDGLRREWVDCQRRVDELDPGGLPAEATERLYAELRRTAPSPVGSDSPG